MADVNIALSAAVELLLDSITGEKISGGKLQQANRIVDGFSKAIADSIEGRDTTVKVPVSLEAEVTDGKGKKGRKKKADPKKAAADLVEQIVRPQDILNEVKRILSTDKYKGKENIKKALEEYFNTIEDAYSTVSLTRLDNLKAEKILKRYSTPEEFDRLTQASQRRLNRLYQSLNAQKSQIDQINKLANKIKNRFVEVKETTDADGNKDFESKAFRLPPIVNDRMLARGDALGQSLAAFKSTSSRKNVEARRRAAALAKKDIEEIGRLNEGRIANTSDVAGLQTILQTIDRRVKAERKALLDSPEKKGEIEDTINRLLGLQANAQVRLKDISPISTLRRQQTASRLDFARRTAESFWVDPETGERKKPSDYGKDTYFQGYKDAYNVLLRENERKARASTSQEDLKTLFQERRKLRDELKQINDRRKEVEGSTLGKSYEEAKAASAYAQSRAEGYLDTFNRIKTLPAGLTEEEKRQVMAGKRQNAVLASAEISRAISQARLEEGKATASDKPQSRIRIEQLVALQDTIKQVIKDDRLLSREQDNSAKKAEKTSESWKTLASSLKDFDDLVERLDGTVAGSRAFNELDLRAKNLMRTLSRLGGELGTTAFDDVVNRQVDYLDAVEKARLARSRQRTEGRKETRRTETTESLKKALDAAYRDVGSYDVKTSYLLTKDQELGVEGELARLSLLRSQYGSNASKAMTLGLEQEAAAFVTLGQDAKKAADNLEKFAKAQTGVKPLEAQLLDMKGKQPYFTFDALMKYGASRGGSADESLLVLERFIKQAKQARGAAEGMGLEMLADDFAKIQLEAEREREAWVKFDRAARTYKAKELRPVKEPPGPKQVPAEDFDAQVRAYRTYQTRLEAISRARDDLTAQVSSLRSLMGNAQTEDRIKTLRILLAEALSDVRRLNTASKKLDFQEGIDSARQLKKEISDIGDTSKGVLKEIKGPTATELRRTERDKGTSLLYGIGQDAYAQAGGSVSRIAKEDHEAAKVYFAERLKQIRAEQDAIASSKLSMREQRKLARELGVEFENITRAQNELRGAMNGNVGLMRQLSLAARSFVRYFVLYGAAYSIIGYFRNLGATLIDFQDSLKQTQVIAQATKEEMGGIGAAIRDVASTSGDSLQNVAQAAETLAQAGIAVQNIPAALQAVSDFALATGSSLQVASDIITSAKEIFGEDLTFAGAADQLTRAVNISKLRAEDLRTIFNLGAQTAQSSGLSSAQFLGAASTLSNLGIKSSTVATGLRQLLLELFNPDDKTIAFLRRRYNELGERLTDQQIVGRFREFQQTSNPLMSALTELRRLGAAGAAQDDFRRVLDIRAENVALPLIRRLDELARNTSQISDPGAATAGAADRVDTLSKAFDQLKVKAQLLAEVLSKPVLNGLIGFTKGLGEFVDKVIAYKEKLALSGNSSVADVNTAGAGGVLGFLVGRRMGLGNVGTAVTAATGAAAATGTVASTEAVAGRDSASALNYVLNILGILALFGKRGKALEGQSPLKAAVAGFEWLAKGFNWLKAAFSGGVLASIGRAVTLLTRLNPLGVVVAGMYALVTEFESLKALFTKPKDSAPDLEAGRARIAEAQRQADQLRDQAKQYDADQRGSLVDEAKQIQKSLDQYDAEMRRLFGNKAVQAQAILAELGNIPIESGTRQAEEIRKRLEREVNGGQAFDSQKFARLVQAQSDFTASQQALAGKAEALLKRVSELLAKPKDKLTDTEKKFLETYQSLKDSPLFKPDAFKPGDLAKAVQDYFRLIADQTAFATEQYRAARAAASAQNYALSGLRQEVRSGYGSVGDNNIRQSLNLRVAQVRQNPTPEGQQFIDDFRSALNEIVNDLQPRAQEPQVAQLLTEVNAQIQALGQEMQTNTGAMDARDQRAADQRQADQTRQEDVDRRRRELAEEAEKAERLYIELTTQRNTGLELINELDGQIRVAKEKQEYQALLGPGGLLERKYKAELEVLKADEELAAAKLRKAALEAGVTLPKGVGDLSVDQITQLNQNPEARSLYDQYMEKRRKVREAPADYKTQRELIQQESLRKIDFVPDQAFIDRQNEINRVNEELGDQVRESQDQLREKYNRLFELEDKNLDVQIEYLKSQEYKYNTPTDQAKFRIELNDLEQRREKLRRETTNKRDEEIARLGEAEAKARADVIEQRIRLLETQRDQIAQSATDIRRAAQEVSGVPPAISPTGVASGVAPNGEMIRRLGDRQVSVRARSPGGERINTEDVSPELMDAIITAAQYTPNAVEIISGKNSRSTGTPNHPAGDAIDIQLTSPTGDVLANVAHGPRDRKAIKDFREYEKFWQMVKAVMATRYSHMPFRYGGYFSQYMDSMHGDVHSNAMGYGDWVNGANADMRRRYPGLVSIGMGDVGAFAARMEGLPRPANGNYRAPEQGAGVLAASPPQLGSPQLDQIDRELTDLRRQLFEERKIQNSYGKSPEEIAQKTAEDFAQLLRGTYDDMIRNGERQIDYQRNVINSTQQQVQLSESLLRGVTPMEGAARDAAGLGFSPEQELEYLRRVGETLDASVSATNEALTKAQDLLTSAETYLQDKLAEQSQYKPGSALYREAETKIQATEQLIERYKAAVQEFGSADNEAVARMVRNRQERQNYDPSLFGTTEQVPIVGRDGKPLLNKDGSPKTTEVKTYGQIDQAFDAKAIAGELNNLAYSLKNLGKNIRGFIVGAVDTFVSTIADKLVRGAEKVDTAALNQARADLYQAQGDASYNLAQQRKDLAAAEATANQMPGNAGAQARRADMQAAYAESSRSYSEAVNARKQQVKDLEQQQQGQGIGGALQEAFTALSQEFASTMLKTILLSPFQAIFDKLGFGQRGSSRGNPLYVEDINSKATPGAPGQEGGGVLGSEKGGVIDSVLGPLKGIFDEIVGGFGSIFNSIMGALGSLGGGGGSSWVGAIGSIIGGLVGFAEGGHVKGPGTGTSDSIPAWLSNGEYVLTKKEVDAIGVQNIEKWKAAMASPAKFATGGLVQTFDSAARNTANYSNAGATGGSTDVTIIDQRSQANSEPVSVSRTRGPDNKEVIQVMVRDAVKNAINSGMMDRTMRANYGARRTGAR